MKNFRQFITIFFAIIFASVQYSLSANDGSRYASASKLASGKWIKLKTTKNAIYKLTYEDIKKMGIADPAKVKLYGYGGWMLNEDFTADYIDDLQEIAVWINKGSDGVFGSGDYLLFYGRGATSVKYSNLMNDLVHQNNPYSTYGAYFMTESDSGPKESSTQPSVQQTVIDITDFRDFMLHETDSLTITNTGRELFGESFVSKNTQTFDFNIPGGVSSLDATLSFAARTTTNVPLRLDINDKSVIETWMPDVGSDGYRKARIVTESGTWTGDLTDKFAVKVTYPAGMQTVANLNYITLQMYRKLQLYGSFTFFRNASAKNKSARFVINNATSGQLIFDVTDPFNIKKEDAVFAGNQLSFGIQSGDEVREFVVLDPTKNFETPELLGEVQNQNLHGLPQTEMVILVPKAYLPQAELLAEQHRIRSGLKVTVVQADLVFNEFSSGVPDATAYRRFMKMFYDRATTDNEKPKYLLLFGDGMFDNRFLTPACSNLNKDLYLLTFQVNESVYEPSSYGTDDYFGFLDDGEALNLGYNTLDLGIGRFPVSSTEQANNAINKIFAYMDNLQYGSWKNMITFTADDTDSSDADPSLYGFCAHAKQADVSAKYMETNYPEYLLTKAYQDAFKQVTVNGRKTYPDAKNKLMNSLKNGVFLLNYTGHGSTTAWTSENLMTITDVNQLSYSNLPLWITATCDFGWFDGINNSAGEAVFQNKKSGGIALFTTSRVVYSTNNLQINTRLMQNLFAKTNGEYLRLGDVLRISKNQLPGDNNKLNYILLGDPALRLNFPGNSIKLDAINGKPVNKGDVISLKALEKVTITGRVIDVQGNLQSGFNGTIHTTAFDSQDMLSSALPDKAGGYFQFADYPNRVYTGNNVVEGGLFTVTFTVPLDISYSDNHGKLNFYASDEINKQEANGSFEGYILNGSGEMPDNTGEGPEILGMYLNSTSFKSGDQVNETPYFVAEVHDQDGINITDASLGHNIAISIDNSPSKTYNLNSYFQADAETYGQGSVKFSIPALPAGQHQLIFTVWDLLNNPSTDSLTFNVVEGLKPQLYDVTAAGNPARVNTHFLLSHDRPDTYVNLEIVVYDLTGRPLWHHSESGSSEWLKNYAIEWNLCADNGMPLKPGIYVYRAAISTSGGKEATKGKKIIILGQ